MGAPGRNQRVVPFEHLRLRILLIRVQLRRRARIVIYIPGNIIPHQRILVGCRQREGRNPTPFRTLKPLNSDNRIAVLVNSAGQIQRLPAIRIGHGTVARLQHIHRSIHRNIVSWHVVVLFIGTILIAVLGHAEGYVVSQRCRIAGGVVGTVKVNRITKLRHEIKKPGDGGKRPRGILKTLGQQPVCSITDGFSPRSLNICGNGNSVEGARVIAHCFPEEIGLRLPGSVVNGPHIVHEYGKMKQIACVHRRAGKVLPDTLDQYFIPLTGNGLLRLA